MARRFSPRRLKRLAPPAQLNGRARALQSEGRVPAQGLVIACTSTSCSLLSEPCRRRGEALGSVLLHDHDLGGIKLGGAASDPTCTLYRLPASGHVVVLLQHPVPEERAKLFFRSLLGAFSLSPGNEVIVAGRVSTRDVLGMSPEHLEPGDEPLLVLPGSRAGVIPGVLPAPVGILLRGETAAVASHCQSRGIPYTCLLQLDSGLAVRPGASAASKRSLAAFLAALGLEVDQGSLGSRVAGLGSASLEDLGGVYA